jgi:polyhydroxyalkanoate synthesis regulator phasin
MTPSDPSRDELDDRLPGADSARPAEGFLPGLLRKTLLLGLGSVSMTEEGVRRMLSDLRLPREEARKLFDYLVDQSSKSKADLVNLIGTEVKAFLRTLDLEEELRRVLTGLKVQVRADISFDRRSGDEPQVGIEVRRRTPRRTRATRSRRNSGGKTSPPAE